MALFSNATEFEIWYQDHCVKCIHDQNDDCPILAIHSAFMPERAARKDEYVFIMDSFIPVDPIRGFAGDCVMFVLDKKRIGL